MLSRVSVEGASWNILDVDDISGSMELAILRSSWFCSRMYPRKPTHEAPSAKSAS